MQRTGTVANQITSFLCSMEKLWWVFLFNFCTLVFASGLVTKSSSPVGERNSSARTSCICLGTRKHSSPTAWGAESMGSSSMIIPWKFCLCQIGKPQSKPSWARPPDDDKWHSFAMQTTRKQQPKAIKSLLNHWWMSFKLNTVSGEIQLGYSELVWELSLYVSTADGPLASYHYLRWWTQCNWVRFLKGINKGMDAKVIFVL